MSLYTLHLTSILYYVVNEGLTKEEVALISTEIRATYFFLIRLAKLREVEYLITINRKLI